jgi:hypothetical protein
MLPRFLALVSIVVLVIPSLLLFLLHLPIIQGQLLTYIAERLGRNSDVEIRFSASQWQPFSRLSVLGLNIRASGIELVKCSRAELTYRLSWSRPYLLAEELYLERPFLHLEKEEDGTYRLFRPNSRNATNGRPGEDVSFWARYPFPRVHIVSGVIEAEQNGHQVLSLRDMNATFSPKILQGKNGRGLRIDMGK